MATSTRPRDPTRNPSSLHRLQSRSTRNKENVTHALSPSPSPSPSPSHAPGRGRAIRPSLVKSPDKQAEFWTDSFLGDNASQTSLIPSPLPASKASVSKPRRIIRPQIHHQDLHQPSRHRLTRSDLPASRPADLKTSYQKPLARGTSPIRSAGLSTPPSSRDGSFAGSPNLVLSSPPQALTDTYSRIDQEEDLAATEGEISDPESESAEKENVPAMNASQPAEHLSRHSLRHLPSSRASTPTNQTLLENGPVRPDGNLTRASILSDPTGMSFVDQLSDPGLRSALTPHMLQSAADRDALYKTWQSKKPIAFGKAGKVLLDLDDVADSVSSSPRLQPERVIAFSKAGKIKLASDHLLRPHHHRTFSDVTQQIDRPIVQQHRSLHNDNWHDEDLRREAMPHNPRVHREPYFPRNHGFPGRRTSVNQDRFEANAINGRFTKARSESPFTSTSQAAPRASRQRRGSSDQLRRPNTSKDILDADHNHPEADSTLDARSVIDTSSDIWAQAAADKPLTSIEDDSQPGSQSRHPDTQGSHPSPEKSRRFDLDFTGQSFQVSESPPVRGKHLAQDYLRDKEIRGLTQQAVTTNRLNQLRARESQEKLRRQSRSPASETGEQHAPDHIAKEVNEPDTPVVTNRTSSHGSGSKSSSTPMAGPTPDRSRSHDILQRLARGSSSTPKSSTPSDKTIDGTVLETENASGTRAEKPTERTSSGSSRSASEELKRLTSSAVQATPKVVGAWTDTILPDTIKTTRRSSQNSRYLQTPHVNAGAWVDTPAPSGQTTKLEPVQEATQEIPEELMNGIGKDNASDKTVVASNASSVSAGPRQTIDSLARNVLEKAKHETESQDDSLNLGNTTIQSIEYILDMDETTISQLGDTEVLDRLGTKLGRLQTHIHDAQQGISHLEHRMSQPAPSDTVRPPLGTLENPNYTSTSFPLGILTLSIPIPILYRSRKNGEHLPRPTPLGWIVLAFWLWYFLECTFAGKYSHPQYAEQYTWPSQPEPEFPFVMPTMLWRWSHLQFLQPSIIQPLQRFLVGIIRMVGMWFGVTDGFADGPANAIVSPQVQLQMEPQDVGMVVGTGFDMVNDEYV